MLRPDERGHPELSDEHRQLCVLWLLRPDERDLPNSVTSIGDKAFYGCTSLTSVTIPNSMTSIAYGAFSGCSGLTSVKVPVTDYAAFCSNKIIYLIGYNIGKPIVLIDDEDNEIKEFVVPDGVTDIGNYAFGNCSGLTSVTIPSSVTSIGNYAFEDCSGLTSVIIPSSVTSIGGYAFNGCNNLIEVTIPNSVTSIGNHAFEGNYNGSNYSLNLNAKVQVIDPSSFCTDGFMAFIRNHLNTKSVVLIDEEDNEIKDFVVPDGVTNIGNGAFWDCSGLTSVIIPSSVTSIGGYAFNGCNNLIEVTIPNSVTSIGNHAFEGNYNGSNYSLNLNAKVQVIDPSSFCTNSFIGLLKSCFSVNSFVLIDEEGNEIKEFVIPEDVTTVSSDAFYQCNGLTSVIIPNSVTSIGDRTFYSCSGMPSITIPNSVTSIGEHAFQNCNGLISINVTDLVAWCNINFAGYDSNPLYYAHHLYMDGEEVINLVVPNSVTSIGDGAFAAISDLTDVYCYPESVPTTTSNPFVDSYIEGVTLHVTEASVSLYRKTGFWKTFKSIVPIVEAPSQKCATPTIAFINGKLTFTCETEDVEYVYSFSSDNFRTKNSNDNPLASILRISCYATKEGFADSDAATLDIDVSALKGDVNGDGEITIADAVGIVNIILGE